MSAKPKQIVVDKDAFSSLDEVSGDYVCNWT